MSEVMLDIDRDGVVTLRGFPEAEQEDWAKVAQVLTGYFRYHGLTGPENAQARLDAFSGLLDQYGIDKTGMVSGIVQ